MKEHIAAVIPVFNRRDTTIKCIKCLKEDILVPDDALLQIIVVDDGSTDGTSETIKQVYPEITVIHGDGNLWWTGAINRGVEFALTQEADYVLTLNDDLDFDNDFLFELLTVARNNPQSLVSSIKLNKKSDGSKQIMTAGFNVKGFLRQIISLHAGEGLESTKLEEVISCDILTGAALLIPVETVKKIGNFDDVNFPHHLGDFEFSRRSSLAGFRCLVATKSRIYTEYNRNYAIPFLLSSTRTQYIKSLFNNPKYYHGIRTLLKSSYMHKSILIGSLLFGKEIVKLLQNLTLKVILPNNVLRAVYSK